MKVGNPGRDRCAVAISWAGGDKVVNAARINCIVYKGHGIRTVGSR
jgi:hypothetical protein